MGYRVFISILKIQMQMYITANTIKTKIYFRFWVRYGKGYCCI